MLRLGSGHYYGPQLNKLLKRVGFLIGTASCFEESLLPHPQDFQLPEKSFPNQEESPFFGPESSQCCFHFHLNIFVKVVNLRKGQLLLHQSAQMTR